MGKYLKEFQSHSDYNTYITGQDKILPNVSYCVNENEVHYNPWYDPERFVAKFNVTTTTTATSLFNNPTILQELEIDGVKYNGNDIFSHYNHTFSTTGIHTVKYTLTDGTTSIDGGSFAGKSNMVSITIPDTITELGPGCFSGCIGLTKIDIPNSVTTVGQGSSGSCFGGCTNLRSVKMPNSVTTIGQGALNGTNLAFEDVIFDSINPNATFVVDTTNKCITNIGGTVLLVAFSNTVAIPSTVTTIGNYAVNGCSDLTNITIPNSVTTIGSFAFGLCTGLTSITSLATTAPAIEDETFYNINTGGTLYVPSGSTGYDVWMGTGNYYLGKYNWTKVEQ